MTGVVHLFPCRTSDRNELSATYDREEFTFWAVFCFYLYFTLSNIRCLKSL